MFALQKKKRILKGALFSSILLTAIASVFMVLKQIDSEIKVDAAAYTVHIVRDFTNRNNPLDENHRLDDHSIAYSTPSRADGVIGYWITSDAIGTGKELRGICADPNFKGPDTYKNSNPDSDDRVEPDAEGINLPAVLLSEGNIITNENVANYSINGYNGNKSIRLDGIKFLTYLIDGNGQAIGNEDKTQENNELSNAKMDALLGLTDEFYNRYLNSPYNSTDPGTGPNAHYDLVKNGAVVKQNIRYAFAHAVIVALLHGNSYSVELTAADMTKVKDLANNIMNGLTRVNNGESYDENNTELSEWVKTEWAKASAYKLYHLDTTRFAEFGLSHNDYKSTLIPNTSNPEAPWKGVGNNQDLVWVQAPSYGSITVTGCDAETGGCASLGSSSMKDTSFEIINKSGHPIYYDNKVIENNGQVTTKAITNKDACALPKVSNLPYGTYEVKQIQSGNGYNPTTETKTVIIPENGQVNFNVSLCNQVIRGDVKFKKVDDDGKPIANVVFRITSDTTRESHIVVTNEEGVVDTSAIAHSSHTNGYDNIEISKIAYHNDYGTWFGKKPNGEMVESNDSLGALPYDSYTIEELACEANGHCYNKPSEKSQKFTISRNNVRFEFNESWENTCVDFSLVTSASDDADGDKYVVAGKNAKVKDSIEYRLKQEQEYTLKGTLIDKETKEPVKIAEKPVESSIKIKSEKEYGTATMIFTIADASSLAGKEVVVFQSLYEGEELVEEHADINDAKQTILFVSLDTTAKDKKDSNGSIEPEKDAVIVDSIDYCLKADQEYVIEGVLMDKATKEQLLVDGKPITKTANLKTIKSCGKIEMEFKLDSTKLGGTNIVVFERVYLKGEDGKKGDLVVEHADIDDNAQLIKVLEPIIPDTGFITAEAEGSESSNPTVFIALGASITIILGVVSTRVIARKKILH